MDEDIYDYEEFYEDSLTEEELIGFRACLSDTYRGLPEEELEEQLIEFLERMAPEEAESFRQTLANIGQTAAQIGSQILPALGTTIGSLISPGVGTAIGSTLGNIGGQLLGTVAQRGRRTAAPGRPAPATAAPTPAPAPTGAAAVGTATGSPSVGQLLQLLQTPQVQQALASARLGQAGVPAMTVGSPEHLTTAPPAAFLNLISSVAGRAAMEVAQFDTREAVPGYLEGAEIDLANPDERAGLLWENLRESADFRLALGVYREGDEDMDDAYYEAYEDEFIPLYEAFDDEGAFFEDDGQEALDGDLAERRRVIRRRVGRPRGYYVRPRYRRRRVGRPRGYYVRPRRRRTFSYARPRPVYRGTRTVVRRSREDYNALDWLADAGLIEGGAPYTANVIWQR